MLDYSEAVLLQARLFRFCPEQPWGLVHCLSSQVECATMHPYAALGSDLLWTNGTQTQKSERFQVAVLQSIKF